MKEHSPATSPEKAIQKKYEVIIADGTLWHDLAKKEIALAYAGLSDPPLKTDEVTKMLSDDGYYENNRSQTAVALSEDPQTHVKKVAGTLRIILGKKENDPDGLKPIDGMNYIVFEGLWPHVTEGISEDHIGELGRMTIPKEFRDDKVAIAREVTEKCFAVAAEKGITYLYAIMPEKRLNQKLFVPAGIKAVPIEGAKLQEESAHAKEIFNKFPKYWKSEDKPLLFRFIPK